jgi:hypothetical protein
MKTLKNRTRERLIFNFRVTVGDRPFWEGNNDPIVQDFARRVRNRLRKQLQRLGGIASAW